MLPKLKQHLEEGPENMNVVQNLIITEKITNERRIRKQWEHHYKTERVEDEKKWCNHRDATIAEAERKIEDSKLFAERSRVEVARWVAEREAKEFKPKGQRDWEARCAEREQLAIARQDATALKRVQHNALKADATLAATLSMLRTRVAELERANL